MMHLHCQCLMVNMFFANCSVPGVDHDDTIKGINLSNNQFDKAVNDDMTFVYLVAADCSVWET